MHGGAKTLLVTAALATVGCAPGAKMVEIRPIADPSAKLRLGGPRLAQAKGQLALGNVGLALEAFRIVTREQPGNTEALAGIAACYTAMGRFDLARQNYEAALAISPNDPALLSALAASLDSQGMRAEAAEVRAEVAQLQAASAALDAPIVARSRAGGCPGCASEAGREGCFRPARRSGAGRSIGVRGTDRNGQAAACAPGTGAARRRSGAGSSSHAACTAAIASGFGRCAFRTFAVCGSDTAAPCC